MTIMRCSFYAPGKYKENGDDPLFVTADLLDYTIVVEQVNRFDAHQITLAETWRDTIMALPDFATVDIEQVGLGDIARGIIESPENVIDNRYVGKLVLTIPNLTDQCLDVTTGLGYTDAQAIGQVVANLGALPQKGHDLFEGYDPTTGLANFQPVSGAQTGWAASFLDDGKTLNSSSPVTWARIVNAVTNGNIITRAAGGATAYDGSGGSGTPIHFDVTQPCSLQWQIIMPSICQVGLRGDQGIGTPAWGFDFSAPVVNADQTLSGTVTVIANGALVPSATGSYSGNTTFSVALTEVAGVPTMQYLVNNLPVYASALTPFAPFVPVCLIASPNGEVDNLIFARTVPTSQAWFQVQYPNKPTQLAALLQLATDTGMYVRQARESIGRPARVFEFGPFNQPATVTARDGRGGVLARLRANPNLRLIDEITSYKRDVSGYYTVATPLGGTTGTLQVNIELLWRILNDPLYQNFYGKYSSIAGIFPEYDPSFGIYRTGVTGTPEFYIRYEPAMSDPTTIKEGGPVAISQIVYPQQATIAQQEAAQRLLYVAYIEAMKRALQPHTTIAFTTIGDWYPPRAGDQLHIDYTKGNNSVRTGAWAPVRILTGTDPVNNPDPRVLSVARSGSGDDQPMDTILVSNLGKYPDTVSSQAAASQRNIAAIQVTTANGSSTTVGNPSFAELDADNPITLPFFIPYNVFRITAFYFAFTFWPFRQPISDVTSDFDNPPGTEIFVTVGGQSIVLPTPSDINALAANIGGVPGHQHQSNVLGGGSAAPDASSNWIGALVSGSDLILTMNGKGGTFAIKTTGGVALPDLTPTSHPHVVAKQGDTIAHIPAATALAPLPSHVHPIPPGIKNLSTPTGITFAIDQGDGVFLERTAQLTDTLSGRTGGTAFTGNGVVEMARFMNFPGRTVSVRISSVGNSNNGRGRIGWNPTVILEAGGPGSIVQAQQ